MGDKSGKNLDRDRQPVRRPRPDKHSVDQQLCLERTALRVSMTQASIGVVRQNVEEQGSVQKEHYDSGESETDNENVRKLRKLDPVILVGSVDATPFQQVLYRAKFYKSYIDAATQLLKIESKLDPATKKWFNELKPIIEVFAKMASYSGSDRVLKRKYHREIWRLTKKYGSNKIYGKKGFLNFSLAFRRIVNIYPKLKNVTDADFKLDDLPVEAIKLTLGKGRGNAGGEADRHAYMVVRKKQPPKVKPPKKPKITKKPAVKPTKVLKFGSDKFYKHYEITDKDKFDKELAEFDKWQTDPAYIKIKNPDFWTLDQAKTPTQREVVYKKLFEDGRGKIFKLYAKLSNFKMEYDKWFKEGVDPKAQKLQELYFWAAKRMAEYTNDFISNAPIRETRLLQIHMSILDVAVLRKSATNKKQIVEQLVASAKHMEENDPNPTSTEKWKKLRIKYMKELNKL